MKALFLAVLFTIATFTFIQAQNHFEMELDPLAYSIGGASGHIAYTWKNERVQLGYGKLELPKSFRSNENVKEAFQAISLKWDYFFGQENSDKGFFAGPTFDYLFLSYEDENTGANLEDDQLSIGLRAGYRFDLFKQNNMLQGLYLTPWVGTSWLTNSDDIVLGDQSYSRKSMNFFPTIHIGWSF